MRLSDKLDRIEVTVTAFRDPEMPGIPLVRVGTDGMRAFGAPELLLTVLWWDQIEGKAIVKIVATRILRRWGTRRGARTGDEFSLAEGARLVYREARRDHRDCTVWELEPVLPGEEKIGVNL